MTDAHRAYEPILTELLTLYPALLATGSLPPTKPPHRKVPHIAHGWFMRVQRGVEAILQLDEIGYATEAVSISRSVIEHVLALKWLAVEGNNVTDTIARAHANFATRLRNASATAEWRSVNIPEIEAAIDSVQADLRDASNDYLMTFRRRLERYGDVHSLPEYITTCERLHPSYESAMTYVDQPSNHARHDPKATLWQVPFCTSQLLEGIMAYRAIFDPAPWFAELEPLLTRYVSVTDAVRAQDGLPAIAWSGIPADVLRV
jgi:hypothetical protein